MFSAGSGSGVIGGLAGGDTGDADRRFALFATATVDYAEGNPVTQQGTARACCGYARVVVRPIPPRQGRVLLPNRANSGLLPLLVAAAALSCSEPMAPVGDEKFDIALDMPNWVADPVRRAFEDAAATWAAILAETEFQDVSFDGKTMCGEREVTVGDVDDVLVLVSFPFNIDGSLALAGICVARARSHEPIVAYVNIDRSELPELLEWGLLYDVVLHEMAHALGFGVMWDRLQLVGDAPEAHFTGPRARAAFDDVGGRGYEGARVPTESDHGHWRTRVFGPEIMTHALTGYGRTPLSIVTLQAMADMGYRVDLSMADDYRLPHGPNGPEERHRPVINLDGDLQHGPVILVDEYARAHR